MAQGWQSGPLVHSGYVYMDFDETGDFDGVLPQGGTALDLRVTVIEHFDGSAPVTFDVGYVDHSTGAGSIGTVADLRANPLALPEPFPAAVADFFPRHALDSSDALTLTIEPGDATQGRLLVQLVYALAPINE